MPAKLINFGLYQMGWIVCVWGASVGWPAVGAVVALLLAAIHFVLAVHRKRYLVLGGVAAVAGLTAESLMIFGGAYRLESQGTFAALPPAWIVIMWIQFSTLLPMSLSWLSGRYALAAVLGGIGGLAAFLAGEGLGAVEFLPPRELNLAALGAVWCVLTPALVFASDQLFARGDADGSYRGIKS